MVKRKRDQIAIDVYNVNLSVENVVNTPDYTLGTPIEQIFIKPRQLRYLKLLAVSYLVYELDYLDSHLLLRYTEQRANDFKNEFILPKSIYDAIKPYITGENVKTTMELKDIYKNSDYNLIQVDTALKNYNNSHTKIEDTDGKIYNIWEIKLANEYIYLSVYVNDKWGVLYLRQNEYKKAVKGQKFDPKRAIFYNTGVRVELKNFIAGDFVDKEEFEFPLSDYQLVLTALGLLGLALVIVIPYRISRPYSI